MSLNVGELMATLGVDDSDFNTKLDKGKKEATDVSRWGKLTASLHLDASKYHEGLTESQKKWKVFAKTVDPKGFGRAAFTGATLGVAALGVGLGAGAIAGVKFNSSVEQTTIAMGTMLGSTSKAKTLIGEVVKMAASTPFQFPELADATKRLVAYGVASGDAIPLMMRLGDISSALQIPIGELSDIYGKMKVSGRIQMDDINQMAGRGIPIYTALAKVLGVNESKIRGMVEKGKIGFPDIEKAFASMTGKGSMFGGMMDKQSRSFSGLWSTIVDSFNIAMGTAVKPLFDWLTKTAMPGLIAAFPSITAVVVHIGSVIGDVVSKIGGMIAWFNRLPLPAKIFIIAFVAAFVSLLVVLGAVVTIAPLVATAFAFMTGPVGIIITAIAALVAGFVTLWLRCDWFRNFWIAVWDQVKVVFAAVWPAIKAVVDLIVAGITFLWNATKAQISWFWGWAGPYIKTAVQVWWTVIKAVVGTIINGITVLWDVISAAVKAFWHWAGPFIKTSIGVWWENIKTTMNLIHAVFDKVWSLIVSAVRTNVGIIKAVIAGVATVVAVIRAVWDRVHSAADTVWRLIVGSVRTGISGIKTAVNVVKDIVGVIGAVWTRIHNAADTAWSKITGIVSGAFERIKGFANSIIGVINWVIDKVPGLSSVANVPTFGGTGRTTSTPIASHSSISSPAVSFDPGGLHAGAEGDSPGGGKAPGSMGTGSGTWDSLTGWIGDLVSKFNIFDKLPRSVGGLFGGATNALLGMGKDAIWGLLKKFGLGDRQKIVDFALSRLGDPYVWGGSSPGGFDCSGLMYWAYRAAGHDIPRIPTNGGRQIGRGDIQPADIMFFYPNSMQNGVRVPFGHFKMYAGNNETVESTSGGVQRRPADWGGAAQIRSYLANGGITRGLSVVGEGGRGHEEVVIPLDNPARGAAVMRAAGMAVASPASVPAPVIHEHYYIQLPGGSAIVGNAEDVGRQIAPAVGRQHNEAAAERARSR